MAPLFTVAEANALLPEVRRLVKQMMDTRAVVHQQEPEIWAALAAAVYNGGSKTLPAAERAIAIIQGSLRMLQALGVQVKDIETGLVDFPADHNGDSILLCWQWDEPKVAFWHDEDSGFAGRQPIDWSDES